MNIIINEDTKKPTKLPINREIFANTPRTSRRQPRNRAMRDVVAAGDLAHRLAVAVAAADRLALLVQRQLPSAAERVRRYGV